MESNVFEVVGVRVDLIIMELQSWMEREVKNVRSEWQYLVKCCSSNLLSVHLSYNTLLLDILSIYIKPIRWELLVPISGYRLGTEEQKDIWVWNGQLQNISS